MRIFRTALFTVLILVLAALSAHAQLNPDLSSPVIVINLPSRTLELYSGDVLVKVYPLAIGKPSTPTPLGSFSIIEKEVDPWWYPPRSSIVVPSGPDNPLGYRWMSFFPTYGIHGTNAPWSIGMAVSNGCIRMFEKDVEELFELVPDSTPVRITYDRVKVRIDSQGAASIGIYPDVYGYQSLSLKDVANRLAADGLGGLLTDDELIKLINEEKDRQVVFAQLHSIKVNGRLLADRAVAVHDTQYVPVWPVAGALGANIIWDEQNQLVRGAKRAVAGALKGDKLCVTAADAQLLFGGQHIWQPEENSLAIDVLTVFLNGNLLSGDVQVVDGIPAVPLQSLAEGVGQEVVGADDDTVMVQGSKVSCATIADQQYIQITKVYEMFHSYVYWNQQARSIEVAYPFKVTNGND